MKRRVFGRLRWWGRAILFAGVLLLAAQGGVTRGTGDLSRAMVSLATLLTCVLPATATGPMQEPPDATVEMPVPGCGAVTLDRVDTMWITEC